jgi:predicted AlkP superfamily phosphohydrolase/phosphomutase
MAKSNFVNKAQKDIFNYGKRVEYVSAKGKREGQTLSKTDRTIPRDDTDTVFIAKGESYYWWQFQKSPKQYSKTRPRASQLTQSGYLSTLYGIAEQIEDFSTDSAEEYQDFVENIKTELEDLRDNTQESLDNMPENLQYSPTAELLQERIDSIESGISEIESIDFEYEREDEEELKELIADDLDIDINNEDWDSEITEEQIEEKRQELEAEWVQEKLEELQAINFE